MLLTVEKEEIETGMKEPVSYIKGRGVREAEAV